MPGPAPKNPKTRQRRNVASTRLVLEPRDPKTIVVPELPASETGWHELTEQAWNRWWSSPVSSAWDMQADLDGLFALAAVLDDFWREPTTNRYDAVRKGMQAYGLSPIDRRRLEWTIDRPEPEVKKRAVGSGRKKDMRAALRSA